MSRKDLTLDFLVTFTILLFGCASPVIMKNMIPKNITGINNHPYSVYISSHGGETPGSMTSPDLTDEAFLGALKTAIRDSHVFSKVISINEANYSIKGVRALLCFANAAHHLTCSFYRFSFGYY